MEKNETIDGERKFITISTNVYFNSKVFINIESTDEKRLLSLAIKEMINKLENYTNMGSGWTLKEIFHLEMHTVDYKPMKGGEYIPLPEWIMRKKAIVSLRNTDNKCFIWSVLRYLHSRQKKSIADWVI